MAQQLATMIAKEARRPSDEPNDQEKLAGLWKGEIKRAQRALDKWLSNGRKIVKRYRDEASPGSDERYQKPRYNILYSNTETLRPALYAKPPKAVVARRYLDKDSVGRIACRVLQRSLQYQIDAGDLDSSVRAALMDYLLPGRGQVWIRYYPEFERNPDAADYEPADLDDNEEIDEAEGETSEEPQYLETIKSETICVDYVNWEDFLCDPARTWDEVGWVARRVYMAKPEIEARFPDVDAKSLEYSNGPRDNEDRHTDNTGSELRKAPVWEIWHKAKRKIVWINEGLDQPLDEKDDPLHLKDFWPCPKPLDASTTTNTLIPVPFFQQYKPQAEEMDDLTVRIDRLIAAAQVKGAYDQSIPALARVLQEAAENELIPVENWPQFTQGGGLAGALQFLPIDMFVKAVGELYTARDKVKADINEISGVADIIRGQGDPQETATGVVTKGKFASLRLKDMQGEVARFIRDIIRIMSEIIAGQFQPETIEEMSSAQEMEDLTIEIPDPNQPAPAPVNRAMANPMPPQGPGQVGSNPAPQQMQPQRLPAMAGAIP